MTKSSESDFRERTEMVQDQIVRRGISDQAVIDAMIRVPRELMVHPSERGSAFCDGPLPIGYGQTISQPYIVAYMTEQLFLEKSDRVLEIGTGSAYQTAVLAEIASKVFTIEIIEGLAEAAREKLSALGYSNIEYRTGDGAQGWPEKAPFDAIIVTAAPAVLPQALTRQLRDGGRLVIPVGSSVQYLRRITRRGEEFEDERLIGVRFVPMTGTMEEEN